MKNIIYRILIISLLVLIAGTILFTTVLRPWFLPVYILLFVLFTGITLLYCGVLVQAARKKPDRFISWFMGVTGIKFMLYLGIMVLYLLFFREHAIPFLLTFLVLYFIYTPTAIILTLRAVRK